MSTAQAELRRKQIEQAEELLFSGPQKVGFAKDLFFGHFRTDSIFPYPSLPPELEAATRKAVDEVRQYTRDHIDAARIDRDSRIPDEVVHGLGQIGVLGMCVSPRYGGRGFSQQQYCRVMEVIGAHCGGTTVFVNAHHSIGLRAIELFGTEEQKDRWLATLSSGETLAAFALTEPEAGSDAANVRTRDANAGWPRLCSQRRQALHHQRRDCRHVDRDGPYSGSQRAGRKGHRLLGHARHARI